MDNMETVEEVQANNLGVFMEGGPRLTTSYRIFVVGRDDEQGCVVLGGLGCMGVGQRASRKDEYDEGRPGWADAPAVRCVVDEDGHVAPFTWTWA